MRAGNSIEIVCVQWGDGGGGGGMFVCEGRLRECSGSAFIWGGGGVEGVCMCACRVAPGG